MTFEEFNASLHRIFTQSQCLNRIPLENILAAIPRVDALGDLPPGTPVLIRADLDSPLKDERVVDTSRIESCRKTITYCLQRGWKTVLLGHIGRDVQNTLAPVCTAMQDLLSREIVFVPDWIDESATSLTDVAVQAVDRAGPGSLIMFENTRRYTIERALWKADETQFPAISRRMHHLAMDIRNRLAAVEINEAIAASNIDFSSTAIPLTMAQSCLGFYIDEEMKTHVRNVRGANLVVFSGLKINKLDDLEGIVERGGLKTVFAAGSLAMSLLKARARLGGGDVAIGRAESDPGQKAYIDSGRIEQAKRIVRRCNRDGIELVLPVDFVLDDGTVAGTIPADAVQMDIGPATIALFERKAREYAARSQSSQTSYVMFYNGVFGKFEDPRFEKGTRAFIGTLRGLTRAGVGTYVGGGEGRLALIKYGHMDNVTHAFTCGGTILKSLTDRHIAYLKAMYLQNVDNPQP